MQVAVWLLLALLLTAAALIRQWWAISLPLVVIPVFYVGLKSRWWGAGVGDGWQYAAALVMVIGLLGSMLGVALGRFLVRLVRD